MIKLLSTDFDGTVVNHDAVPRVHPDFFAVLGEMNFRPETGRIWRAAG